VLKAAGLEASRGLITRCTMKEITDPSGKNDKGFHRLGRFMSIVPIRGAMDDQSNAFGTTWRS